MQKLFKNVEKMAQMRLINNSKFYWIFIAGSIATPLLGKTRIDQSAMTLVEGRISVANIRAKVIPGEPGHVQQALHFRAQLASIV